MEHRNLPSESPPVQTTKESVRPSLDRPASWPTAVRYRSSDYIPKPASYPILRFIGGCFAVLGWISLIAAILDAAAMFLVFGATNIQTNGLSLLSALATPFLLGIAIGALVSGLVCLALSQLIRLFLDIGYNVALIARATSRVRDPRR
jgi:hypothetical protein